MSERPDKHTGERNRLIARKKALGLPCHLCGYPIDLGRRWPDRFCFVLDEIEPRAKDGDPLDWDNTAGAHKCCNEWRGTKPVTEGLRRRIRARYEKAALGASKRASGRAKASTRLWY